MRIRLTSEQVEQLMRQARWIVRTRGGPGQHARIDIEAEDGGQCQCQVYVEPAHSLCDLHPIRNLNVHGIG